MYVLGLFLKSIYQFEAKFVRTTRSFISFCFSLCSEPIVRVVVVTEQLLYGCGPREKGIKNL